MRTADSDASVFAMREPMHVRLEIERQKPIAGHLITADGQQPFTGWLGLISELEAAVAQLPSRRDDALLDSNRRDTSDRSEPLARSRPKTTGKQGA
jgi:hypothetical protein